MTVNPSPLHGAYPPNPEPQHPVTSPVVSMQTSILGLGSVRVQHPLVNSAFQASAAAFLSEVPKRPLAPAPEEFLRLQKLFLLLSSFPGVQVPAPRSLSLYFPISFALSCSVEISLPFLEVWDFCQCSESVLQELFHMQMHFLYNCEEKSDVPVLPLHHLETSQLSIL